LLPDFILEVRITFSCVAISGEMPGEIQFDEYNIADTTMPMSTYTLHLPAFGEFVYAVLSPQRDAIVWSFTRGTECFGSAIKTAGT